MTSASDFPELVRDSRLPATIHENVTIHPRLPGRRGTLRHEKWLRVKPLGHGGGGIVWLERKIEGPGDVALRAVKSIRIGAELSPEQRSSRRYVRELEALAKFSQEKYTEFFVKSYGWYNDLEWLYISMEYCEYLDLGTYLKDRKKLPEDDVQDIASQILGGLSLMHENHFAHRDLKPANILIKSKPPDSWWVKLCDLGLSRRSGDASGSTTVRGTPDFMAPETIGKPFDGDPKLADPFCADMWCLGETISHALTGHATFEHHTLLQYQKGSIGFPEESLRGAKVGEEAISFLSSLMKADPIDRLTVGKAFQHAWMKPDSELALDSTGLADLEIHSSSLVVDSSEISFTSHVTQESGRWTTTMTLPSQHTQASAKWTETIANPGAQMQAPNQPTKPSLGQSTRPMGPQFPPQNSTHSGPNQQSPYSEATYPNFMDPQMNGAGSYSSPLSNATTPGLDPASNAFRPSQPSSPMAPQYPQFVSSYPNSPYYYGSQMPGWGQSALYPHYTPLSQFQGSYQGSNNVPRYGAPQQSNAPMPTPQYVDTLNTYWQQRVAKLETDENDSTLHQSPLGRDKNDAKIATDSHMSPSYTPQEFIGYYMPVHHQPPPPQVPAQHPSTGAEKRTEQEMPPKPRLKPTDVPSTQKQKSTQEQTDNDEAAKMKKELEDLKRFAHDFASNPAAEVAKARKEDDDSNTLSSFKKQSPEEKAAAKTKKLGDLKEFSKTFKLHTPVPDDLTFILSSHSHADGEESPELIKLTQSADLKPRVRLPPASTTSDRSIPSRSMQNTSIMRPAQGVRRKSMASISSAAASRAESTRGLAKSGDYSVNEEEFSALPTEWQVVGRNKKGKRAQNKKQVKFA